MNKRDVEVYNLLLNSEKYITSLEMSKIIGCSEKTIRNSLDRIEKELDKFDIKYKLERKQSVGIKLDVEDDYVINDNIDLLILDLLKNGSNYITDLQKKYFISYNEIRKQIMLISYKLKNYDIDLDIKQKQGIVLDCKKCKLNKYLKDFFFERIDNNIDQLLNYYYSETEIKIIDRIINEFQNEEDIILTDYSKNYIKILLLNSSEKEESFELNTNHWISILRNKMKLYLNFEINKEGIDSLLNFFESKNFFENVDFLELQNYKIDQLIENLEKHFAEIGENFLSNDKELISNLKNHLKLTLYKRKNGKNSKNPICNEIKEQYPYYFNEVFNVVEKFNSCNQSIISVDEVAFIVIYVVAVEKISNYKKIKALVVCNFGRILSKYLIEILRNNFEWIDFEDAIGVEEIKNYNIEDYLVFSTIKLEDCDYIKIPGYIDDSYIEEIKIDVIRKNSNYVKLFSNERFKLGVNLTNKEEVIKKIVQKSEILGLVEKYYLDSVIYRESLDSTEVGEGIVLLHGDDKFIKKSHISFYNLASPIDWEEDQVKYIFLIAVKKYDYERYDMRQFFKQLIKLKTETNKIEELSSLEDFVKLLSR